MAGRTTFILGRAVILAAEDAAIHLKSMAAVVLRCAPENLEIEDERVFPHGLLCVIAMNPKPTDADISHWLESNICAARVMRK